jgi:hypothetical protein
VNVRKGSDSPNKNKGFGIIKFLAKKNAKNDIFY